MAVHALQRIGGPAFIAKGAVVIVLDNHGAQLARAFQQRVAARHAHRHAERELLRRRGIDQFCTIGYLLHHHAVLVHLDADHVHAQAGKQLARHRIAGLFHRHRVARFQQGLRQQRQCLLRAIRDQDLLRRAPDAAAERGVAGDRRAQDGQSFDRAIVAPFLAILAQRVLHAAAPFVVRKQGRGGAPTDKGITGKLAARSLHQRARRGRPARQAPCAGQHRAGLAGPGRGVRRLHETADADPAQQQLLIAQPVIHVRHRLARQAQLAGQQARRRQLLAVGQAPRADRLGKLAIQLPAQVASAFQSDM